MCKVHLYVVCVYLPSHTYFFFNWLLCPMLLFIDLPCLFFLVVANSIIYLTSFFFFDYLNYSQSCTATNSHIAEYSVHIFVYMQSRIRRRQWHPSPVLLPGKSRGRRSLVGYSPWGCEDSDTTERLHFHALEKEMATQLQCSCLENPRDRGAWWAAVYGVAQSWTRLT